LLPNVSCHVDSLARQLNDSTWSNWLDLLASDSVNLRLPKFKIEAEYSLKDILCSMGMPLAFNPDLADFGNISDMVELYISGVKHKTYIEVDEEGTEAAAVTSIEYSTTSIGPEEINMWVNRPFLFIIYENEANTILFTGKVVEPAL